jgi:hypothetical protein
MEHPTAPIENEAHVFRLTITSSMAEVALE